MKVCTGCKCEKPLDQFGKHAAGKDGLRSTCKSCSREKSREYYSKNRDRYKQLNADWYRNNTDKRRDTAAKWRKENRAYLNAKAIIRNKTEARKKYVKNYAVKNKEKIREYGAKWYAENRDRVLELNRQWYRDNKEAHANRMSIWSSENKDNLRLKTANRRARLLMATPRWVDMKTIEAVYIEASRLTERYGIQYEVDHVVPLRSKLVCGLHVPANLQVMEKSLNREKKNIYWPDMP